MIYPDIPMSRHPHLPTSPCHDIPTSRHPHLPTSPCRAISRHPCHDIPTSRPPHVTTHPDVPVTTSPCHDTPPVTTRPFPSPPPAPSRCPMDPQLLHRCAQLSPHCVVRRELQGATCGMRAASRPCRDRGPYRDRGSAIGMVMWQRYRDRGDNVAEISR